MWISTSPFQLGKYVCYDLKKVFSKYATLDHNEEIIDSVLTIPEDPFLNSAEFKNFKKYKILLAKFKNEPEKIKSEDIKNFMLVNPEFYLVYQTLGDYYKNEKNKNLAAKYYKIALTKEIPWLNDAEKIKKNLKEVAFVSNGDLQ